MQSASPKTSPSSASAFSASTESTSSGFGLGQAAATNKKPSSNACRLNLHIKVPCKNCRNPDSNYIEDFASGDLICRDCGGIVGDRIIDTRSEWRTFSNDDNGEDPSRVGGPMNPLLDSDQLDTIISGRDGGSGIARELSRLQNRGSMKVSERILINAFKTISDMCDRIGLPKVISDRAKQLFKKVEDEKILKGKTNDGIMAACIYMACRQEGVARSFKEISALTLVSKKDIGRCFKLLSPLLETQVSTVSTEDFMARFCSYLNLNSEVQRCATQLARKANQLGVMAGKSPLSVAAAGIYMITQLFPQYRKNQKDISFVAGVSEITIKNTYKDLYAFRHELIGPEIASPEIVECLPMS